MFAKHFQQSDLSDIQLVIKAPDHSNATAKRPRTRSGDIDVRSSMVEIKRFPSHRVLLSSWSEKLAAQMNFAADQPLNELTIELDDESHLAAAEAVFAAMYEVPNTIQQQDQPTLVTMLMLANQHDIPRVVTAVSEHLHNTGLSAEGMQAIFDLPALPAPLWHFVAEAVQLKLASSDADKEATATGLLLRVLEDLEEVWTEQDSTRRNLLQQLPLEPLLLLLQSEQLKVVAEDTIVFTIASSTNPEVQRLLGPLPGGRRREEQQARLQMQGQRKRLASVVRVPHLSTSTLAGVVPQLDWLNEGFSLKQLMFASYMQQQPAQSALQEKVGLPAAWMAGPRSPSAIESCTHRFEVEVQQLRQQAEGLAAGESQPTAKYLSSVSRKVFAGRRFQGHWVGRREAGGVAIHFAMYTTFPGATGVLCWCGAGAHLSFMGSVGSLTNSSGAAVMFVVKDCFGVGAMAGGWDAAAWASRRQGGSRRHSERCKPLSIWLSAVCMPCTQVV